MPSDTNTSGTGHVDWDGERYEIVAESDTHLTLRPDRDLSEAEREFGRSKPVRLHKRLAERWEATDGLSFSVERSDQDPMTDGGSFWSHYEENGNRDPRGLGTHSDGGHHGQDLNRACPFCGEEVALLPDHLPCNGEGAGAETSGDDTNEVR